MIEQPPCPGNGLCCDRPESDRAIFPCSYEDRLRRCEEAIRRLEVTVDQKAARKASMTNAGQRGEMRERARIAESRPRYIVYRGPGVMIQHDELASALLEAGRNGGIVYEPLGMTTAEKVASEPEGEPELERQRRLTGDRRAGNSPSIEAQAQADTEIVILPPPARE